MDTSRPEHEAARISALRAHHILDTPPEDAYDDIALLAAHNCGTTIAAITLVDAERQWFKSIIGLDIRETPRNIAFCSHTILQSDVMIVPDAEQDARFADSPLVTGEPHIRFYAGIPLVSAEGHNLGTLCVLDRTPRRLRDDQVASLRALARLASGRLELTLAEQKIRDDNLLLAVQKAQLEAANTELAALATTDPLTGLLNHRAFHSWLDREVGTEHHAGEVQAVVILDLDDFRFFNEIYGHSVGDSVLKRVASRLLELCGSRDAVAHFGGDEFTLLLADVGGATAADVEARLTAKMSDLSYRPAGGSENIPLTISVGAALLPPAGPGRREAVHTAEDRLRLAKTGGSMESEAGKLRLSMLNRVEGFSMLDALVTAVDNKDRYTRRHSEDVMGHGLRIAAALGWGADARHAVAVAALLHDVGKIGVPDHVLRKPGRLTEAEAEAVRQHPMMGAIIVQAVPGLEGTLDAVRHHHERWDGGGYPFGLAGEETPAVARLLAVADAYSAMTTDRPYRRGMAPGRARAILREGAGTQWDPRFVGAFLDGDTGPQKTSV